ncbi:MAG TPA: hypothetical protein VM327_08565 [Candidatus Thermoplasmatota archaeon]|nr:hypothetical protein [Candidatus Thermoplasmatota archaeon]
MPANAIKQGQDGHNMGRASGRALLAAASLVGSLLLAVQVLLDWGDVGLLVLMLLAAAGMGTLVWLAVRQGRWLGGLWLGLVAGVLNAALSSMALLFVVFATAPTSCEDAEFICMEGATIAVMLLPFALVFVVVCATVGALAGRHASRQVDALALSKQAHVAP